jgi:hypothetical protein
VLRSGGRRSCTSRSRVRPRPTRGWEFIGKIESKSEGLAEGMYLLQMVPGETAPRRFRHRENVDPTACDHCQTNRRRNETFLVRHEGGDVKQVGRTCIKDFTGHRNPAAIAAYLQYIDEIVGMLNDEDSEFYGAAGYQEYTFTMVEFLAVARAMIRSYGWISRGKARDSYLDEATADTTWNIMTPPHNEKDRQRQAAEMAKVTPEDHDYAACCLEFLPSLWTGKNPEDISDYIFNLEAATSLSLVTWKTAGLVASALSVYARHLEEEIKKQLNPGCRRIPRGGG